jgi:nucleoside-diphosphate-sugar epimerase
MLAMRVNFMNACLFYVACPIQQFVDRVARGLEIQQFGDGSTSRDYTYIDDIVDGVVRGALELASSHMPF